MKNTFTDDAILRTAMGALGGASPLGNSPKTFEPVTEDNMDEVLRMIFGGPAPAAPEKYADIMAKFPEGWLDAEQKASLIELIDNDPSMIEFLTLLKADHLKRMIACLEREEAEGDGSGLEELFMQLMPEVIADIAVTKGDIPNPFMLRGTPMFGGNLFSGMECDCDMCKARRGEKGKPTINLRGKILKVLNATVNYDKETLVVEWSDNTTTIVNDVEEDYWRCDDAELELATAKAIFYKSLGIKSVLQQGPATIIFWNSGEKTVVRCQPGDEYDAETGFLMAFAKYQLGNGRDYYPAFNSILGLGDE